MHRPSRIGAYTIHTMLVSSPSSSVYLGKARASEQHVVIKVWRMPHARLRDERGQIEQECAALAALQHPGILPLLEAFLTERESVVVRAYVPGLSLHAQLAARSQVPLPPDQALDIILHIGAALQAAHEQGIAHGSVTPHNVLLTEEGHARLSDFRISSILSVLGENAGESASRRRYMAPEQFQGECSPAADQYALGCLTYEVLTGYVPFSGLARATLFQKHHSTLPTPPCLLNPAIPSHVERAVLTALAKTPGERYHDLQAFLERLAGSEETLVSLPVATVQTSVSQQDSPLDTTAISQQTVR